MPLPKILGLKPRHPYWNRRSRLHYYEVVKKLIEEHSPGKLIIDVGSFNTPVVTWGKFKRRICIDLHKQQYANPKVENVVANWLDYKCTEKADVILCLQVLEHLDDDIVKPFARKIVQSGRFAIISVPYMWDKGLCKWHKQDPIDLTKLEKWAGYSPLKYAIDNRDKHKRLIGLFEGCEKTETSFSTK